MRIYYLVGVMVAAIVSGAVVHAAGMPMGGAPRPSRREDWYHPDKEEEQARRRGESAQDVEGTPDSEGEDVKADIGSLEQKLDEILHALKGDEEEDVDIDDLEDPDDDEEEEMPVDPETDDEDMPPEEEDKAPEDEMPPEEEEEVTEE